MKKLNKKGFTLTEILVAMSIVAILSAVAVPSYTRMKITARTTEAKTNLGQLYISEKSFFIQWGCYISDLITIGFRPEGELLYNIGFHEETPNTTLGSVPANHPCTTNYNGPAITGDQNDLFGLCGTALGSGTLKGCAFTYKGNTLTSPNIPPKTNSAIPYNGSKLSITASSTEFTAVAIADVKNPLSPDTTKTGKNIWTVNHYKQIIDIQDIDGGQTDNAGGTTGGTTGGSTGGTTGGTTT